MFHIEYNLMVLSQGDRQLFSYGSADVILGACTEFWDGEDIQPLTDSDRSEFYVDSCCELYVCVLEHLL